MNSRIYRGSVMHVRNWEAKHRFEYPHCFCVFDIEELGELDRRIPVFGYNRKRLTALHDKDYLAPGSEPIAQKLQSLLEKHECSDGISRVMLITCVRFLGYVFNPVSFFLCLRADGTIRCVVANINNTFGDSHIYVLKDHLPPKQGFSAHFQAVKDFHVSPFFDLKGVYDFNFSLKDNEVDVLIRLDKQDKTAFVARLRGKGIEFNTCNIGLTLLKHPFSAFLTVPRISWQAAHLYWQRGLPIHHRPNPKSSMTLRCSPPTLSARIAMKAVERVFRRFRKGDVELFLPDRKIMRFGESGSAPSVKVEVRNWDFFPRIAKGSDIGLGEAYMAGDWDCADPAAFIRLLIRNWDIVESERGSLAARAVNRLRNLLHANTRCGSRRNIHEHYDLSNDFFKLFLDETMMYSCAFFDTEAEAGEGHADPLEAAQHAKIRRILDKAGIGPEDHVLEIGCGWGAIALETVKKYGCRYTGITVSENQLAFARESAAKEGLSDRISFEFRDYRDIQGSFSRIISIEMLEAVGHKYLGTFFASVDRALAPGGHAVIQVIAIPDSRYDAYRRSSDFIRRHMFPGGHLPSLASLKDAASRSSKLEIQEIEHIGAHYAETLKQWRERLLSKAGKAGELGFDEAFLRKWNFYFSYCEAAFSERIIDNLQFVLRRAGG